VAGAHPGAWRKVSLKGIALFSALYSALDCFIFENCFIFVDLSRVDVYICV
jgi:hypothetical protein